MAIPVIDFSKLDGPERAETMAALAAGFEHVGFFQLVNTGISDDLLERVKKVCSDSYKLRDEAFKDSNPAVKALTELVDKEIEDGLPARKIKDMDWEDVFTLHDDLPWPSNPPAFKETMMEYRRELKKLAEKMLGVMEELLGLEEGHIRKAFSNDGEFEPFYGTKVSHYPPCPRPDLIDGLRAHTDAGGLILLFQDDRFGGLQAQLPDGSWVDVQPLENAIVINTGDQIEVLSNGRYKSAWHRILATRDGNRRSIASFYNPARLATIAPAIPAAGVGDDDYPSFVFGNYMEVYVKQKFQPKAPRFEAMATTTTK
ncbi:1-aminocyclopropane-1-carboxylate oxidase [Zea mays]|uniref:1-aminocyclopropane-1-carboxylate oxidase n=2 Tax=Zea mays TaxID=4577 RepID=B6SIR9_MAIZE|nr:1-aminocyclopropane-1-carboxylate oxidase isoform 1 [Zea mays]ACG24752.1 1-aminocyclopropane-1-carboxylate oxidase [Zea mays]ONM62574.1 1-aminocyclopropane-1-carboxylate oxidase [Zea mays]PWZ28197.1 1-aminocyclopropane-1-carboxylate oxidase [Zea mays]|eukprot:NP_001146957.1 1-aminocyclopropane-1-carboxylate oxidase [Zea mays]